MVRAQPPAWPRAGGLSPAFQAPELPRFPPRLEAAGPRLGRPWALGRCRAAGGGREVGMWPGPREARGADSSGAEQTGAQLFTGPGGPPCTIANGTSGEGTEGESYSQRHSCLLTSLGKVVSGLGLGW